MAVDLSVPLEQLIAAKLGSLSLRDDEETVEFVRGLVEEDSFEPEDRKSAILGMLELDEEDARISLTKFRAESASQSIDALLDDTSAYQEAVAERERAEQEAKSHTPPEAEEKPKKPLTAEEEARRKADLLKRYGDLEDETEAERQAREEEELSNLSSKALKDPSQMSRKQRKKAFDGVDLLALPNLNKHHVQEAERQKRTASAGAAQAKREKDLADRKKQKDDAAKKLEEKRKRAQKVERKG
ncbi:hypothetical protein Rhopal_004983-T1 [Rhodotorula paludigena]|uniref:Coiled-coil domain-containing protein 43 n=1 Tax=Rhodotorula paludigena TaxID=86838 RepID=A0AAV5GH78_9BASI|nr:hypothetical protein Rhopal_004983-T1 [Rhodotorula paludigena]